MKCHRRSLVTAATLSPVAIEEARRQCKIDHTEEDRDLQDYIEAATAYIEQYTGRALMSQTWDFYFDGFDSALILPLPPLVSIISVKYQDGDNTQQTLVTSIYETGDHFGISCVRQKYNQQWPATLGHDDDVVVRAVVGYGTTASSVPAPIRQAIKLLVSHQYMNRTPIVTGTIVSDLPWSLAALLRPYELTEVIG